MYEMLGCHIIAIESWDVSLTSWVRFREKVGLACKSRTV